MAEFRSVFTLLGRTQFFNLVDTLKKNHCGGLFDLTEERLIGGGLDKLKSELREIGGLGVKFLDRIPHQKTEKEQIEFIKTCIRHGLNWYVQEVRSAKDTEIISELEAFEKRLPLVPLITMKKAIAPGNERLCEPVFRFREFNFDTAGFEFLFEKPNEFSYARLMTILASAQYLSKGHTTALIAALSIGRYRELMKGELFDYFVTTITSNLHSIILEEE